MGRAIQTLTIPEVQGPDSKLEVTYHFRGQDTGKTSFALTDAVGRVSSFALKSVADAEALINYLDREINHAPATVAAPNFEVTGYALKVMCDGNVIKTMYDLNQFREGVDSFNYISLKKAFPEYSTNDYFYVVYGLKDNGIARETLETVIDTCVSYQLAAIISGDLRVCRPMTQLDIARITGFDNTTVSRCVKQVRIFTAHRNYSLDKGGGTLDFPSLFDEGVLINGKKVSSLGIKVKIRSLVDGEDKTRPLTDDAIAAELAAVGYPIARRTVVKYRETALGIPSSHDRKIRV